MRILHIAAILLLVHIISMTACSREAQPETSTLSGPTAPSAGIGRRVEDPGGVTPAPTPTPCPLPAGCSFITSFSFSLTVAGGDVLSGTCDERLATCPLAGTGRFTDAILRLYAGTTRVSSFVLTGNQLAVTLMLNLPSLGNQTFLITGTLDAEVQTVANTGCQSGLRQLVTFSGVLEQVGIVTGTYSVCVPAT